jgi:uncharacterized protein with von Willebrand factor type A (vWA) domain
MEEPKKFEDLPAIKSSTLEEYILEDGNEGFLEKMIHSLQEKLAKNVAKKREEEYFASPAGKQYLANEAERIKQKAIYEKRNAAAYEELVHEAKMQMALELEAEEVLIKKYKLDKISNEDPRLGKIINELQRMREVISNLYFKQ